MSPTWQFTRKDVKKQNMHYKHLLHQFANVLSDDEVSNNEKLPTVLRDMISISNRSDKIEKIVTLSVLSADHSKQKIADYSIAFKDEFKKQESLRRSKYS